MGEMNPNQNRDSLTEKTVTVKNNIGTKGENQYSYQQAEEQR